MRVKSATGKSMEVRVGEDTPTVQDVLDVVALEWDIPAAKHQLLLRGTRLNPEHTLKEAGVGEDDEMLLRGKLRGGCVGCNLCGVGGECCCSVQ
jgi:hypothetical protein